MEIWYPIPENTLIHDRAFRINIENSDNPVLSMFVERAYDVGGEEVTKRVPELDSSISMSDAFSDPELSPIVASIAPAIQQLSQILWNRKAFPIINPDLWDSKNIPSDSSEETSPSQSDSSEPTETNSEEQWSEIHQDSTSTTSEI